MSVAFRRAALRFLCATCCTCPVTSGVVTVPAEDGGGGGGGGGGAPPPLSPLETFSRTVDFPATRFAAFGVWATTVPFGCEEDTVNTFGTSPAPRTAATAVSRDWPTVSGTVTRPRATRMTTVEPPVTWVPAPGVCATTVPLGCFETTPTV